MGIKDELKIIEKYSGRKADNDAIITHPMGELLLGFADRLRQVEGDLRAELSKITSAVIKVRDNLDAGPGDQVYPLSSHGEFQSNPDALIAVRAILIEQIRALAAHVGLAWK